MIEVSKVTKRFGDNQVLRGVDLTVAGGRVMGLVGPNGAGKTTLIKTLLGLCQPTSGEIRIDGDKGTPIVVANPRHPQSQVFLQIAQQIVQRLDERARR